MTFSTGLIRHATRRLRRAPIFAVAAALTLALGIGATTAVYTLVDAVLIRPLPYADASRLVDLSHSLVVSGVMHVDQSDATYLYYRRASRAFSEIGAYRVTSAGLGGDRPQQVSAARVSASVFRVLGASPSRGRVFTDADDDPNAPPVVVLSERVWRTAYGADPSIVGRRVQVDGAEHDVVGIMPRAFRFPEAGTDAWLPIGIDPAHTKSAAFDYRAVGRLRNGVTIDEATADLQRLLPQVPEAYPGRLTTPGIKLTKMRAVIRPLRDVVVGDVGRVLWVVLGAVAFVLLIACANVANLFLVRADGRQQELAVRRALGAGRVAITAELVSEGALLCVAGGGLGLGLAALGVRALQTINDGFDIPRLAEVAIDGRTIGIALALTALAVVVVSLLPAMRWSALPESRVLAESSRSATTGRVRQRARGVLVAAQVALALMLLAGAGLMARSFARLRAVQPGFDAGHAATFRVSLPRAEYGSSAQVVGLIQSALENLSQVPGVQAAGVTTKLPLDATGRSDTALFVRDRPLEPGKLPNIHQVTFVSPDYFRALGIPVVEGRTFGAVDAGATRALREVIVSRSVARRYWSDGQAVGRQVRMISAGDWFTVVGVAGDVRGGGLEQPADETVYLPLVTDPLDDVARRWSPRDVAFVVRSAGVPSLVEASAEGAIGRLAPSLPVFAAHDMSDLLSKSEASTTVTLSLLAIASIAALLLGAIGIYGVVSYTVSLRTREIAVRIALGADPAGIRRLIAGQAVRLASIGVVVGLAGAVAVTRVLAALLYGVSPTDPTALGGAAVVLLLVALAASVAPARRASAVDPAQALHSE